MSVTVYTFPYDSRLTWCRENCCDDNGHYLYQLVFELDRTDAWKIVFEREEDATLFTLIHGIDK